jgi:hypothetical protein
MEITKNYLLTNGWKQDSDLYFSKNGHEYDFINYILWLYGSNKGIYNVVTTNKLEELIKTK